MQSIKVQDFNLKATLESGQFFLYYLINQKSLIENQDFWSPFNQISKKEFDEMVEGFYYIIHTDKIFKVKQENDVLYFEGIKKEDLVYFFSLDIDYSKIYEEFNDDLLQASLVEYRGLRIIRQDLWQCLVSFVCSSCSNIPKITKNLELMSEYFGKKVEFDSLEFYTFPSIGDLNDFDKLKDAKTGYRADYLFKINEMLTDEYLEEIQSVDYNEAKKLLMELPGIGSKVADCICLFSLGHVNAFPVDTWVKQIVEKYYLKRQGTVKEIEIFGGKYFGKNAGIKQQYLFHYVRNLK